MITASRTAAATFNSTALLLFDQISSASPRQFASSIVQKLQEEGGGGGGGGGGGRNLTFFLVAALKSSATSLRSGEPLHALAFKSGLARADLYVRNSLLNLYAKSGDIHALRRLFSSTPVRRDGASWNIALAAHAKFGLVDEARYLFDRMPRRNRVSFTTLIMCLAQNGRHADALAVFRAMIDAGVTPNEVTLAGAISSCSRVPEARRGGKMIHSVAVKCGLDEFVLVGTNLVHLYAVCSQMEESRTIFEAMPERNTVTWNVMLNGYAKAGLLSLAEDLFERIPLKDLVSWSTMIDGYLRCDRLEQALNTYSNMLRNSDARPNEVLLVDLISACGRHSLICEGQQLHAIVFKAGLDAHTFVQATLIHYYGAACGFTDLARLLFESGCKSHVSSWNALLAGLLKSGKVDEATELFRIIPNKDVVSWSTLISGYVQNGLSNQALELFQEMQLTCCEPNEITMVSVLSAVADSGTLDQGRWIHDCITRVPIPLTENLSASLIDMYAKCGSIDDALQVFHFVKNSPSISPWNAIICGLAMHGYADTALSIFCDMRKAKIEPNAITFIGVLSACCHNGYIADGKCYFDAMRRDYHIEPTIKHYGCMIDLLCRAGCLEEAECLVRRMPMEADVMIWGSMLAAARACGNVKIGEQAAENLTRLEPSHGASRVLLSNIYADAGKWSEAFSVRSAMQGKRLKKLPGCSGIT